MQQLDVYERALMENTLAAVGGNVAADQLCIPQKTLYEKIKKYDLSTARSGAP